MKTFETRFFGSVTVASSDDDTFVECDVALAGHTAMRSLYLGAGLGAARLATAVALLDDLETLDARARAALRASLADDDDGTVDEYLQFHFDELSEAMAAILGDEPAEPEVLLAHVALCGVNVHVRQDGFVVVLDYSPGREHSDQLLAVTLDASGTPVNISHES